MRQAAINSLITMLLLVASLATSTLARADYTSNLQAYYMMDSTSGTTAVDSSGNGRTGTLSNGASFSSAGKYGYAILFDGSNDRVTVAHNAALSTTSFTIAGWAYLNSTAGYGYIAEKGSSGNGNYYFYEDGSALYCGFYGGGGYRDFTIADTATAGLWVHYACTFDNTSKIMTIYKNGIALGSTTLSYTPSTNTGSLGIGWSPVNGNATINGLLDEVRIYSRALSALDIAQMYLQSSSNSLCVNPPGMPGDIKYNSAQHIMQGCNGTVWKGWPRNIAGTWKDISAGWFHTCGIKSDGTAWCWGFNSKGQLGNGTTGADVLYPGAVNGGGLWMTLNAGATTACGIKTGGTLYCWGESWSGITGNSSGSDTNVPTAVSFGSSWKYSRVGGDINCAIKSDDTLWCWGENSQGGWGNGVTGGSSWNAKPVSGGGTWKLVSTGLQGTPTAFACGIKSDGTGWCWGDGSNGQLGNGGTSDSNVPVAVSGGATWKQISAGVAFACGIKTDGSGWCWGSNSEGQLGRGGGSGTYSTPQALSVSGVTTWSDIQTGEGVACGVKTDASGWCWGYGGEGNIGDGAVSSYNTPHEVISGAKWKTIHPNWAVCGIMQNGTLWCWGENQEGAQGVGHQNQTNTPQYVAGSAATTCSSPQGIPGALIFNSDYRVLQWCDGNQWNATGPVGPGGSSNGCSSPAGIGGSLLFNSNWGGFQYCDGGKWRGITQ